MSSINLVSEEMVLQESVVSSRARRDPAGRGGQHAWRGQVLLGCT